MIYIVAKTRRQALSVCGMEDLDPTAVDVTIVERETDIVAFDPDGDEVIFKGIPQSLDGQERLRVLRTLGVKEAS